MTSLTSAASAGVASAAAVTIDKNNFFIFCPFCQTRPSEWFAPECDRFSPDGRVPCISTKINNTVTNNSKVKAAAFAAFLGENG